MRNSHKDIIGKLIILDCSESFAEFPVKFVVAVMVVVAVVVMVVAVVVMMVAVVVMVVAVVSGWWLVGACNGL